MPNSNSFSLLLKIKLSLSLLPMDEFLLIIIFLELVDFNIKMFYLLVDPPSPDMISNT